LPVLRAWSLWSFRQFGQRLAPWRDRAERFGDRKARAQSVLVESVAGPRAAEPGMSLALNFGQALLAGKGGGIYPKKLCSDRISSVGTRPDAAATGKRFSLGYRCAG